LKSLLTVSSLRGVSKSLEETQRRVAALIQSTDPNADISTKYRVAYIVHLKKTNEDASDIEGNALQAIGIITIHQGQLYGVPFSESLTISPEIAEHDAVLKQELGYMFIPQVWRKGYCTEAVQGLIRACKDNSAFWKPYRGLFLHVVVGAANFRSVKIPEKVGIKRRGVHKWDGEPVFLGGAMQQPEVVVFGDYLICPN
jgi:hypothetical protein